ncbi:MAG: oligosaccharide flippase family protein, partial [Thermodesulfobacteriota bacterium]
MILKKRIFTNTVFNGCGRFVSFLLQILIIAYLIRGLGKEVYGIVVLALALLANANILESGFGLSVSKYVAEFKAKGDWKRLNAVVNTNFIVATVLGVLFAIILVVINELLLEMIFTIPEEFIADTKNLLRILIAHCLLDFWFVSAVRVAEGFQRYPLARGMELLRWALRLAFIVGALSGLGLGLAGIGIAYIGASLVCLAAIYLFVFSRSAVLQLSIGSVNREAFHLLFGFSIWVFLSKVFSFFSYRVHVILISIFLPPVNLTYYNVGYKVLEFLRYGFSIISSTLIPVTSELNALMEGERITRLFQKASKYTIASMYPLLLLFFFHADKFIELWVGSGFDQSFALSQLFIVSLFFAAPIVCGAEMMVGINKLKALLIYVAIASSVNFILSIWLIPKLGIYAT